MTEGTLQAGTMAGSYRISTEEEISLSRGQKIEIYLGGHWIAGHVGYSSATTGLLQSGTTSEIGAYQVADTEDDEEETDRIVEASEESFPASDPPTWTTTRNKTPVLQSEQKRIRYGYYFISQEDSSVCGFCIGMQVRLP